jgi:hypothetical protein
LIDEPSTLSKMPDEPAVGIHDHPEFKTGACPPVKNRARLKLKSFLKADFGVDYPEAMDDISPVQFALDGNDRYGTCVPTGFDNFRRLVTQLLSGSRIDASWEDIKAWYRSQNPGFDDVNYSDANDQGMVIQYFLEWLVKQGLILGFAEVDYKDDAELAAAAYLFLGLIIGVDLQTSQQGQTGQGYWDYVSGASEWGGHCVMLGAYEPGGFDVETWLRRVRMTDAFRKNRVFEAWAVILPDHVAHPNFRAGMDLQKFATAYEKMTERPFPIEVPPEPDPNTPPADHVLSFQVNDPVIIDHIERAAHRTHQGDPAQWLDHHFRSYFKIK